MEVGAGVRDGPGLDFPALLDPAVPAAVEDAHGVVSVKAQGPPESGGELAPHVVHGDDPSGVADPAARHRLGEPVGLRELRRDGVGRVDDVAGPIDVDGTRDVSGQVFVDRTPVRRLLHARLQGPRRHVAAHVDHAQVRVVEMVVEPAGGDEERGFHA
jgi:hypothetical protein